MSSSAKDMVRHMMELDPTKRWTAKELLEHVWFQVRDACVCVYVCVCVCPWAMHVWAPTMHESTTVGDCMSNAYGHPCMDTDMAAMPSGQAVQLHVSTKIFVFHMSHSSHCRRLQRWSMAFPMQPVTGTCLVCVASLA